ncbi:hypothetical protein GOBAR_DD01170 [Gossypium barbadense]|nr:hypothetical protein GOBAR_DD01170 [Gossypium barbadense]
MGLMTAKDPHVMFLSETKIHTKETNRIRRISGMSGCITMDYIDHRDGFMLLLRKDIQVHLDGSDSRFTGFCGQSDKTLRHESWDLVTAINEASSLPWLLGGDFNEILAGCENREGKRRLICKLFMMLHVIPYILSSC